MAQHMLEPNMALLPAGEERATRCKDKWEARARRATGVLANARLLCLDAPHKTTSPFSWQCPLQRAQGREHGDMLWRGHAPSPPSAPKIPQHGTAAGQELQPSHCAAGGGQQRFHMDIFFHWLQFGAAKSQNKNGNIPFCWQKFKAGLGFFSLVSAFSFFFFFVLVFGYERKFPAMKS